MPTTEMMIEAFSTMRQEPGAESNQRHFWQLMERFQADLVHQALALLGNQADAEDVTQDTLCRAYQEMHTLKDPNKLGNWLRAINRCKALDLLRKRKAQREERLGTGAQESLTKEMLPGREATPAEGQTVNDEAERIYKAVEHLPGPYREVLLLRYMEKLTLEEIARRLGIPPGTARSRMARADGLLLQRLKIAAR
ncbi:MAG: sigma-70 family RNA polymerase sigma factor [Planctomycetes bacterium]|nr:sigma-70 family RNA polymerase sigma factor [Planctomycetota bacterium]